MFHTISSLLALSVFFSVLLHPAEFEKEEDHGNSKYDIVSSRFRAGEESWILNIMTCICVFLMKSKHPHRQMEISCESSFTPTARIQPKSNELPLQPAITVYKEDLQSQLALSLLVCFISLIFIHFSWKHARFIQRYYFIIYVNCVFAACISPCIMLFTLLFLCPLSIYSLC